MTGKKKDKLDQLSSQQISSAIEQYHFQVFGKQTQPPLRTADDAVDFVNRRGLTFFWPAKEMPFPSLWEAVTGTRTVPFNHDHPGHITWEWKDALLGQKQAYYAKTLRRRNTFTSLTLLPSFYALSENYGDWQSDYLEQYEAGHMIAPAKAVYESLINEGPLHSLNLRKASRLTSQVSFSQFDRALLELMADFKILPVGVAHVGRWQYSHIYDISARHYDNLEALSRPITESQARQNILKAYFLSLAASTVKDIMRFFNWPELAVKKALSALQEQNFIHFQEDINLWLLADTKIWLD